jgi:predicted nucleotidyltransferase
MSIRQLCDEDLCDEKLSLHPYECEAIAAFVDRLLQLDKVQTEQVILFGSKARGDAGDDADIDLLVIVEKADWERKGQIRLTDARVSLEYDVLLNTHILDLTRAGPN